MNLVTGATGHIGNVLVKQLISKGKKVRALILPDEDDTPIRSLGVELAEADILDYAALRRAFRNVDVVYHLASIISIMPGKNDFMRAVNIQGTKNVINAAREAGVRRLVYTSSIHALARPPHGITIDESLPFDPNNPAGEYDRTKARASLEILNAVQDGLDAVLVCPTGVIGPEDYRFSEMGALIVEWMKKGIHFLIDGLFDFVDVRDVAEGHILAAEKGRKGETYLLSGERIALEEIKNIVQQKTRVRTLGLVIPVGLASFIAKFTPYYYQITKAKPRFTSYSIETVCSNSMISNQKAKMELGYSPRSLKITIADTVDWWKDYYQRQRLSMAAI